MKKRLILILLVLTTFISLLSCKETNEFSDVEFDIEVLAGKLYDTKLYDDELVRLSDELTAAKYAFGGDKTVVYTGSGATAEVIIVVEYADKETAANQLYLIKNYLNDQITLFEDYNANELPKLHSAICKNYGRYAVLCVSKDNVTAEEIIKNY